VVAHDFRGRVGDEHLPSNRESAQARGAVHLRSVIVAGPLDRFAGAHRGANLDGRRERPAFLQNCALQLDCGLHCVGRARKDRERAVSLAALLDDAPLSRRDDVADDLVVPFERLDHLLGELLPQLSRTDDVGEEEGHDPAGKRISRGHRRRRRRRRVQQARVLLEHAALELGELGARFYADVRKLFARTLECAQCVDLPPRSILGEHSMPPKSLVVRMLFGQRFELAEHLLVLPEREPDVDALAERLEVLALETGALSDCPRPFELLERRSPPERERAIKMSELRA
jgi:hypothetical protein